MRGGADVSEEMLKRLRKLYDEVDAEVASSGWSCRACGKCCRFAEFGHYLFCSEVEAEYLLSGVEIAADVDASVCPFLKDGACTRRRERTLGCRTYFCEKSIQDRMMNLSERYVGLLKELHRQVGAEWRYRPLRDHVKGLKSLHRNG